MSEPAYPVSTRGRLYDPSATDDERSYSLLMHLSLLAHIVVPYVAIVAPIIMWMVRKDKSAYIDDHGREAVNFQITLIIYSLVAIPLAILTCGIGAIVALLPYPLGLVGMILAATAANRGEFFRYPMTIRFIR